MVNAFDYGDPAPRPTDDFALYAEGSAHAVRGRRDTSLPAGPLRPRGPARSTPADRKPAVLTFVVDVSGSMARRTASGLVRKALGLLLDQLRPDDRVALVVYGCRGQRGARAHRRPGGDPLAPSTACEPEGATNAEEGLALGYDLARRASTGQGRSTG